VSGRVAAACGSLRALDTLESAPRRVRYNRTVSESGRPGGRETGFGTANTLTVGGLDDETEVSRRVRVLETKRAAGDAGRLGHVTRTYCSEVLSLGPTSRAHSESGDPSDAGAGRPQMEVKVLLIAQRVDGFFLERLTDRGELVSTTQHETLDDAMYQAYSEYDTISDWRLCPDDADPAQYLHSHSDPSVTSS
jgi:hypothetical protein